MGHRSAVPCGLRDEGRSYQSYVRLRVGSTQRKRTIGRLGELDLTSARKLAAELSVAARNGVDAIKERKRAQTAQLTFGYAYAEYMASLARKGASAATISLCEKNHRLYLGRFEKRVLTELTRSELPAFSCIIGATREDGRERRAAAHADRDFVCNKAA